MTARALFPFPFRLKQMMISGKLYFRSWGAGPLHALSRHLHVFTGRTGAGPESSLCGHGGVTETQSRLSTKRKEASIIVHPGLCFLSVTQAQNLTQLIF